MGLSWITQENETRTFSLRKHHFLSEQKTNFHVESEYDLIESIDSNRDFGGMFNVKVEE